MGFRFYRRVSVGKGLTLGVSKSGLSLGFGARGARYSVHTSGRTRKTIGLPGTGLSYVQYGSRKRRGRQPASPQLVEAPIEVMTDRFRAGWLSSRRERAFAKGLRATFIHEDYVRGIEAFRQCVIEDPSTLSAYFLGGYCAVRMGFHKDAIGWLEPIIQADAALPDDLAIKYGLDGSPVLVAISVDITPRITAEVDMTTPTTALILAELYQEAGDTERAIGLLENAIESMPDTAAIALSLAELYAEGGFWSELASMPMTIENTDDLSAEALRYKGRAMREERMFEGSLEVLKEALRFRKRHPEVLKSARYERALTYKALGKEAQAKRDFERLYAEDPEFEDVRTLVSKGT